MKRRNRKAVSQKNMARALVPKIARAFVEVPTSMLGLHLTVPEYFKRRGWPVGECVNGAHQGPAFVGAALSFYAVGKGVVRQQLRVPGFLKANPLWAALCEQYGDVVDVSVIVEVFSPDTLAQGHEDRLDSLLLQLAKTELPN